MNPIREKWLLRASAVLEEFRCAGVTPSKETRELITGLSWTPGLQSNSAVDTSPSPLADQTQTELDGEQESEPDTEPPDVT